METDDYLLDDLQRSQLNATRRRRWNRSRRHYRFLLLSIGFLALLVLAAPSLISHSGIARSMLASRAQAYGWTASADSLDVGWITPLSIKGLKLVGQSGDTTVEIGRADTALTVTDLIRFDPASVGEVSLRGVNLACTVSQGASSIESDLATLLAPSDHPQPLVRATIQIQDVSATITETTTGATWALSQSNINVSVDGGHLSGDIAGLVNEPSGSGGAIQSQFEWKSAAADLTSHDIAGVVPGNSESLWHWSIDTESFPLSVTNLISKRFAGQVRGLPQQFSGDTTGRIRLAGHADGAVHASLGDLRIRNLKAIMLPSNKQTPAEDSTNRDRITQWTNELATVDGRLALTGGWLIGEALEIQTDFASATIDGSFPTTISFVGSDDNPLSWLQALEGKADVNVDLASLDRALPGLIPLRRNVALVSGRAHGVIENTPIARSDASGITAGNATARRSKLTLSSDSLRARADGRIVVIDPIELQATVRDDGGALLAEHFSATSSFVEASGSGTFRDGRAKVQIDFGRLYTMLRPVIDLSNLSLGGSAGGEIEWTVRQSGDADRWNLSGSGEAENLLVTLPSGHRFKRNLVQGNLSATGIWDGRTLRQLTLADVAIRSGGFSLNAELMSPVTSPSPDSMFAFRLQSDGRLENLSESLRPWLPESLRSAEGRLTGSATAKASRSGGSLSKAEFVISQPRINYANHWYSQPSLTVKFDGHYDWPSGNLSSQELTVEGDALTLAVRGEMSREKTNLDVAWNADLQRVQESIGSTLARAASTNVIRPISYRPVQRNDYRCSGLCKGRINLSGGPVRWRIDSTVSTTDLAIYSPADRGNLPPGTSTGSVGPQARATYGQSFGRDAEFEFGDLLWQEPRLQIDGLAEYNVESGVVILPEIQVASDGFAGTFAGDLKTDREQYALHLSGPAKWKMEVIADRLTTLLGTPVRAVGIRQSPIDLQLASTAAEPFSLDLKGTWGWDRCQVAGLQLGNATVPFVLTEQAVKIDQTTVPLLAIGQSSNNNPPVANPVSPVGQASFAAEIDYASTPMTVRLDRGARIDSLRVTPATAAGWLQYLTPLAANSTRIEGQVSADFDDVLIVVDDPAASVVHGSVNIQALRLSSGPLANQLIQGVEQIKAIARLAGGTVEPSDSKTLIEMPPQTVDVSFENGIATHQRMYFKIDRANLMTSGRVGIDSSINLVAHVPLDASWLGSDLQGLAGQTLTFPITGTLSRPRLDDAAVRGVMAELGTKAGAEVIQNRLDGLIQKQLGSGMEQINSGLEKILGF